jgi:hypothetical protein
MCWSMGTTVAMVALGSAATVVTIHRRQPPAVPATIAWFTLMEALQVGGHATVDQCELPANQTFALLSYLHIAFQPFFVNAFAMALLVGALRPAARVAVWLCCGLSATVMLMQLQPLPWAGTCEPGGVLCGPALCVVSGEWHIAWDIPTNDLLAPLRALHWSLGPFPTYMFAVFVVPLAYGAWRFVLFHALAGPILASRLTSNPNELPAVWCLFSIGIILIALSPWFRARLAAPAAPLLPRPGGARG